MLHRVMDSCKFMWVWYAKFMDLFKSVILRGGFRFLVCFSFLGSYGVITDEVCRILIHIVFDTFHVPFLIQTLQSYNNIGTEGHILGLSIYAY